MYYWPFQGGLLWIIYVNYASCCYAFYSVHCSRLVVTCWEMADVLALLYVIFYCVFVPFSCGILGQMWYLIVLNPDLCLLTKMRRMSLIDIGAILQLSLGCLLVRIIANTGHLNFINDHISRVLLLILVHVLLSSCLYF